MQKYQKPRKEKFFSFFDLDEDRDNYLFLNFLIQTLSYTCKLVSN